jgi:hypothetical protein
MVLLCVGQYLTLAWRRLASTDGLCGNDGPGETHIAVVTYELNEQPHNSQVASIFVIHSECSENILIAKWHAKSDAVV